MSGVQTSNSVTYSVTFIGSLNHGGVAPMYVIDWGTNGCGTWAMSAIGTSGTAIGMTEMRPSVYPVYKLLILAALGYNCDAKEMKDALEAL